MHVDDTRMRTIRIRGLHHYYGEGHLKNQVLLDNHLDDFEGEIAPHLDISVDTQREILVFEKGLNRSYWELLGVSVDADERGAHGLQMQVRSLLLHQLP